MKSPQEDQYQAAKSINYSKVSSCNSIWIIQIERRLARNKRTRHASHASSIELLFEWDFWSERGFYLRLLFETSVWSFWMRLLNQMLWELLKLKHSGRSTGAEGNWRPASGQRDWNPVKLQERVTRKSLELEPLKSLKSLGLLRPLELKSLRLKSLGQRRRLGGWLMGWWPRRWPCHGMVSNGIQWYPITTQELLCRKCSRSITVNAISSELQLALFVQGSVRLNTLCSRTTPVKRRTRPNISHHLDHLSKWIEFMRSVYPVLFWTSWAHWPLESTGPKPSHVEESRKVHVSRFEFDSRYSRETPAKRLA